MSQNNTYPFIHWCMWNLDLSAALLPLKCPFVHWCIWNLDLSAALLPLKCPSNSICCSSKLFILLSLFILLPIFLHFLLPFLHRKTENIGERGTLERLSSSGWSMFSTLPVETIRVGASPIGDCDRLLSNSFKEASRSVGNFKSSFVDVALTTLSKNRQARILASKQCASTQRIPSFLFHLEIWKLGIRW